MFLFIAQAYKDIFQDQINKGPNGVKDGDGNQDGELVLTNSLIPLDIMILSQNHKNIRNARIGQVYLAQYPTSYTGRVRGLFFLFFF